MITIEFQVTGSQVSRKLLDDAEEFAYFFAELSSIINVRNMKEISDYILDSDRENIANMLENLTKIIREG